MSQDNIGSLIPVLDEEIELYPFNESEYLIQHKTLGYQLNINKKTYDIITLIDGNRSIDDIKTIFRNTNHIVLSTSFIHKLLFKTLAKYGIIKQNEFIVEKRKKSSYLKLRFIILPKKYVGYLTRHLTFFFTNQLFYPLIILMSIFITSMIINNYDTIINNATSIFTLNIIVYLIAFEFGSVFHELGHAAACRKFGAEHGGIGFGFYLFTPVMFADVTDIWKLKPKERIIVNLGGIYFEMIIASILFLLYSINDQIVFLITPSLLILDTLYNLNPLLKFDGYWILSDATNTPNLHKNAFGKLKQ